MPSVTQVPRHTPATSVSLEISLIAYILKTPFFFLKTLEMVVMVCVCVCVCNISIIIAILSLPLEKIESFKKRIDSRGRRYMYTYR